MIQQQTKPSIQERCRDKALEAWGDVEYAIDNYPKKFEMTKWLNRLGYSPMVVKHMQGLLEDMKYEVRNEEGCEQLEEGYSHFTPAKKKKFLKFLEDIDSSIATWLVENKTVRKARVQTAEQKVKKLRAMSKDKPTHHETGLHEIDPLEIIRAKKLFTYNVKTRKIRCYSSYGLNVKATKIVSVDKVEEKTLTDIKLLDRLIKGGNIIANGFMDELKTKSKVPENNLITKNTILIKVVK
jgi:hypothetical protein